MPVSEFIDNEIEMRGNCGVPTSHDNKTFSMKQVLHSVTRKRAA
jgi:hypothetical protein